MSTATTTTTAARVYHPEHAGKAQIGERRGVIYLPAAMTEIHRAALVHGWRIDITVSRALTRFGGYELVAVVAADADADGWRADLAAAGLPDVADRRDARCPGCGAKVSAPWPLPNGWLCTSAHPGPSAPVAGEGGA